MTTPQPYSVKGKRIGAAIIDMFFVSIGTSILSAIVMILLLLVNIRLDGANFAMSFAGFGLYSVILSLFIYFIYYTLIPYISKGSTIAKLMLSIRVVNLDYKTPTFGQLFLRNIFLLLVIFIDLPLNIIASINGIGQSFILVLLGSLITYIIYIVIMIMILATDEERGFHDFIAKTYVIDKRFDIDKITQTNVLERRQMDWAVFEDEDNNVDYQDDLSPDSVINSDEDEIAILKDKE